MNKPLPLLICSEAEADLYLYRRGRESGVVTRIIRGRRCSVLDRCMAEWGAAMQLPYCFEGTWASLSQCLSDLSGFEGKTLVILITSANRVLPRASADFVKMLEVLNAFGASAIAAKRLAGFELVVHAESRFADDVQKRFAAANVSYVALQE